tara:strand:- start:1358 stop:2521 length:1164 start_codon:yes stop_codon:yes gene_type:complete
MKKKIAIFGSTGSIGITTLSILKKDKKNFEIVLLSTNNNAQKIFKQANEFNVRNVIIKNHDQFIKWKSKFAKKKIKIFNNYENFQNIFKKKINYSINAISGLDGLEPTLKIIKYTSQIAIANKESIICGWNLIKKELKKYNTKFIPVDSEHFSIYQLIDENTKNIKKIIITASGGPFLKKRIIKNIKIRDALKHPNWKMGKKITIDSSTLMNKVFEVIEAKKIFNINLNKIDILVNPNSYIHSIIVLKNGIIKILAHEPNMEIPIFNSLYEGSSNNVYRINKLNINKINNINLTKPNISKFKSLKLLKFIPNKHSFFETILISINDELVNMFLNKQIKYEKLIIYLNKIIKFKIFKKYYRVEPKSIKQILDVKNLAKKIVKKYVSEY